MTVQVLKSHMKLVLMVPDSAGLEHKYKYTLTQKSIGITTSAMQT